MSATNREPAQSMLLHALPGAGDRMSVSGHWEGMGMGPARMMAAVQMIVFEPESKNNGHRAASTLASLLLHAGPAA